MRVRSMLVTLIGGLVAAASAGGYAAGRVLTVQPGDRATFVPSRWTCVNRGAVVVCRNGNSLPYVELARTNAGLTVLAHTVAGGGVRVRVVHHPAILHPYDEIVYAFSAF
jgi:hypothetical protein